MESRLARRIRQLSALLTEASLTLDAIAAELDDDPSAGDALKRALGALPAAPPSAAVGTDHASPPEPVPSPRGLAQPLEDPPEEAAPTPPPAPPDAGMAAAAAPPEERRDIPWDEIVDRAVVLLGREPRRTWKPAELCRAVRDSGVALESLQGLHFGLMPRLRQRGAVREGSGGFLASELLAKTEPPAAAAPANAAEPAPAPAAPSRPSAPRPQPTPAAKPRELPWAQMISAAANILHRDPDRAWGQAELVRAVRDFGVPLDNLQGIHFGLTGRLVGLGLADADREGKLRLSSLVGGRELDAAGAAVTPAPSRREPADEVDALTEEVDACEIVIEQMPVEQRTAHVAIWAGRARELQERWKDAAISTERRSALRRVFGRLTRITREQQCGWVDALTPGWSAPWQAYVAHQESLLSGEEAPLLAEEQQALWKAWLRGLVLPNRRVGARDAAEVIAQAAKWLDAADDDLKAAVQKFGVHQAAKPPVIRRAAPPASPTETGAAAAEPPVSAPPAVLELTTGKRAVIVGGTGTREEHREKLQRLLKLGELDWETSERGATGAFARVEERVKHGTYDLVIFLAGYTSHKSVPLLKACKAHEVPLVYVPRGYSGAQVVHAIEEQLVQRSRSASAESP